ncbi:hypothetical protein [Streptomyces sp. NPDC017520]|uniref:hypothetical protein n=1 Tax=Streptomyces sp. NPDC017520 TaxID=3364998 RepID=UPI0037AFBD87
MNASRRHSAKGWLTAIALSALVLTGCGQKSADHMAPSAAVKSAPSPAADDTTDAADAADDARPEDGDQGTPLAASDEKTTPPSRADKTGFRTDADRKSTDAAAPSPAPSSAQPSAPSSAPAAPAAAFKDTSAAAGTAPFAGTEPFVNISKAWISDGRAYLSARTAEKKINTRFDTWEINPGTGPFTTVPLAENSQVLLAVPARDEVAGTSRAELLPYSPAELVTLINRLDPTYSDGIGYDLVVDDAGQVTGLTSLFRP